MSNRSTAGTSATRPVLPRHWASAAARSTGFWKSTASSKRRRDSGAALGCRRCCAIRRHRLGRLSSHGGSPSGGETARKAVFNRAIPVSPCFAGQPVDPIENCLDSSSNSATRGTTFGTKFKVYSLPNGSTFQGPRSPPPSHLPRVRLPSPPRAPRLSPRFRPSLKFRRSLFRPLSSRLACPRRRSRQSGGSRVCPKQPDQASSSGQIADAVGRDAAAGRFGSGISRDRGGPGF